MEAGYKQITHGTYNMHKITNITLKAIAAVLMLAAAASCVFEKENPSGNGQQKYKYVLVQLGVSTDRMTATKADGDVVNASDADGNDVETAIKDLRVYAYTEDGENGAKVLRGYFHAQDVDAAATATKPLLMDIKVPFEEYGTTKQVHFMAVANAGGMTGTDGIIISSIGRDPQTGALVLPETFGFGEFADIRYSVADQTFADGMPMYCQTSEAVEVNLGTTQGTTTSTEPGHNGHTKLPVQVTLDMTRSLAKIMVYAAQAVDGTDVLDTQNPSITIDKVTYFTEGILESGYLFPTENYPDDITTNDDIVFEPADGGVKKMIGTQNTSNIGVSANYTPITDPYYIPENPNGADTWNQVEDTEGMVIRIDYTYTGSSSTFAYVKMPPMVRNTFYKVLCLINAAGEIEIKYIVTDWIIADINVPNFE